LVVVFGAGRADAEIQNRNLLPIGERASMLGNAGVCSPFGEAVFYNPANLTRIDYPSLSVSGSTYLRYDVSVKPALVIDGRDQPFDASGFVAIPSTVTSTYKFGNWWASTAILVPEAIDYKNRVTFESTNIHATLLQQRQVESLWVGGAIAHKLGDRAAVGLSIFGSRNKEAQITFTRIEAMDEMFQSMENTDTQVVNASAILGLYYSATPALALGLRVQTPTIRISGTSDIYRSSVDTGNAMTPPQGTEQVIEGANASRPIPADITVGGSYHVSARLELVADVGFQLPATATQLDDPDAGKVTIDAKLAPRVGVGAELEVATKKWLRLGAMYNGSAIPSPKSDADLPRSDYFGITAGFAFQKDRTVTSLGLFGLQANTEAFVSGASPPREADARTRLYGGLLAFSYRL
jgi:long-subunit fatty acid transport protein